MKFVHTLHHTKQRGISSELGTDTLKCKLIIKTICKVMISSIYLSSEMIHAKKINYLGINAVVSEKD